MTDKQYLKDLYWMGESIRESEKCPFDANAFAVGSVVVYDDGSDLGLELARGYSRETGRIHAEESALSKIDADDPRLLKSTIYTTLEPCSIRASGNKSLGFEGCAYLVLARKIPRVVQAWSEPGTFVDCEGKELLRAANVEVVELHELADAAKENNLHLDLSA
ncbi:hypothetical protein Lfu02_55420 [Longispora fulva]|uniref:Pyrimidine deaminase RibD-like protein n=1 Tax=Longispora fulva TaxID=619741 RepID=A0A8J7KGK5_9ACTN|nr:dCMP deaminase [Longispora fulva]MBG6137475.1 pyrimidine deaminase RibD-like protein [Longispora fulva]GIG61170.1 hypothetical protein Lfu02_55420 [Longispora fulva]